MTHVCNSFPLTQAVHIVHLLLKKHLHLCSALLLEFELIFTSLKVSKGALVLGGRFGEGERSLVRLLDDAQMRMDSLCLSLSSFIQD